MNLRENQWLNREVCPSIADASLFIVEHPNEMGFDLLRNKLFDITNQFCLLIVSKGLGLLEKLPKKIS
ncbi:hypothetical protein BpHYR1_009278 [Brachionus plicatilis]|uniref:Uncharacterized protein n=1 Tax=Brachionus plicatilis TaxID=10195 RepID=A0A3M7QA87_BRAPC|nr:hypothetical protein BpHYR1_009278 [Brachionus plicatilis]